MFTLVMNTQMINKVVYSEADDISGAALVIGYAGVDEPVVITEDDECFGYYVAHFTKMKDNLIANKEEGLNND